MEFIKKELKKMELEIDERAKHLVNKIERGLQKMETKIDEEVERLDKELKKMETEMDEGADRLSNKTKRKAKKMKRKMVEKTGYLTIRMIQGMQKKKQLVWARVDRSDLRPGDHIFVNRICGTYSHHGICIEGGLIIHFTRPKSKQEIMSPKLPCRKCGYQENINRRVVKSCLDCFIKEDGFLTGHSLHLYLYGLPEKWFLTRKRGTYSKLPSKLPEEVMEISKGLFKSDGFGKYDLLLNNCESFATFCKTGYKQTSQVETIEFYIKVCVYICSAVAGVGAAVLLLLLMLATVLEMREIWWIDVKRDFQDT